MGSEELIFKLNENKAHVIGLQTLLHKQCALKADHQLNSITLSFL